MGTRLVAVVASPADLTRATGLRRAPDFFEIRLDALSSPLSRLTKAIDRLPAPLIVTARHPAEGGLADLSLKRRRELLNEFLPQASGIDVELRSARDMEAILQAANDRGVTRIISVHDFERPPSTRQMERWLDAAVAFSPDIFKLAVRTDSQEELEQLVGFFEREKGRLPIAAMGIGTLGRESRIQLARRGSALSYAHLGTAAVDGQLSLEELRREVSPSSAS